MRVKSSLALVALAAASALAACNVLTGLSGDFDVRGAEAGTPVDGGSDGTTPPDEDSGVRDGSKPPVDDGGTPCDGKAPEFWTGFEPGDPQLKGLKDAGAATFALRPDAGKDGSAGLEVLLTNDTGGSVNAWRAQALPGTPSTYSHYDVSFDVNVESVTEDSAAIAIIAFPAAGGTENGILVSPPTVSFGLHSKPDDAPGQTVGGSADQWYRGQILLERNGPGPSFHRIVKIGDDVIDDSKDVLTADSGFAEIRFGTFATSGNLGEVQVRFDNIVACRW